MPEKSEVETTITWSADDERAEVYSLMPRIWRQAIAAGGTEINLEHGIRDGKKIARTYLVPVMAVRLRKARKYTASETQRRREQGRALAAGRLEARTKANP